MKTSLTDCIMFSWCEFVEQCKSVFLRYGDHRERDSEEGHVCQPLHVPRRLQFWLHERSTRRPFLQSAGPQLWLVPSQTKQAVSLMQIDIVLGITKDALCCLQNSVELNVQQVAADDSKSISHRDAFQIMTLPCLRQGSTLRSTTFWGIYFLDTTVS